jgi:hypothetical protein
MGGLGGSSRIARYAESSTALGISGTFNGPTRDTSADYDGGDGAYDTFRVQAFADQTGTLNIQQSRDGTTWRTTKTVAVVASTAVTLEDTLVRRYVRVNYVNGATGQGTFELDSALVAK